MPSDTSELSLVEARRVALAAQGFSQQVRPKGTLAAFRTAIDSLGYIQLDPINVLCRMHYLTVFGRIENYDRDALDRYAWDDKARELFGYWGHQASLLPTRSYALFRWRMERPEKHIWREISRKRLESFPPGFVNNIFKRISDEGPMSLREIDSTTRHAGFNWTDARLAVEWLFCTGRIAVHSRHNFGRIYDITERVIPTKVLQGPVPSRDDAQRELIRIAASNLGVATAADLQSYWFSLRKRRRRESRNWLTAVNWCGSGCRDGASRGTCGTLPRSRPSLRRAPYWRRSIRFSWDARDARTFRV